MFPAIAIRAVVDGAAITGRQPWNLRELITNSRSEQDLSTRFEAPVLCLNTELGSPIHLRRSHHRDDRLPADLGAESRRLSSSPLK
jgi:hypothetical protein